MPESVSRVAARTARVEPASISLLSGGVVNVPDSCDFQPMRSAPATGVWRTFAASHSVNPRAARAAASNFRVVAVAGTAVKGARQEGDEAEMPPAGTVVNVRQMLSVTPSGMSQLTRTRRWSASNVSVRKLTGGTARMASSVIVTFARVHVPASFV